LEKELENLKKQNEQLQEIYQKNDNTMESPSSTKENSLNNN
ncbi:17415_t:CDS:2, partial [Funneliformis geosporum]